ncbi:hypothetical protein P8452_52784 [Trifolium repens]|jgi:hypothetical protein|nr:hypothetical protein P8452_52784 [Trifolium repens]
MVMLMENMKLEVTVVLTSSPNAQNQHRNRNLHPQPSGKTPTTTTTNLWYELQEEREQNTAGTGDEQSPLDSAEKNKNTITERKR